MSLLSDLQYRLRSLFQRRAMDGELQDELRFHLEMEIEKLRGIGLSEDEARRKARIEFGGYSQIAEGCRETRGTASMERGWHEIVYATRALRQSPVFTLVAAFTLALGIGATSAIFSLIQGVLLTPPPYTKPHQLILITAARADDGRSLASQRGWPAQQWMEWKKDATSLQGVAGYGWAFNFLIRNDGSQSMQGMWASRDYFHMMGLKTVAGRGFADTDFVPGPAKSIVLGYEFWQRAFGGDRQIIGKTVRISRWDVPPTVIGIMEPGVRFLPAPGAAKEPNYDANALVDFWAPEEPNPRTIRDASWNVVARLRDGVTPQQAQQDLTVLTAQEARTEKSFEGFAPRTERLTDVLNMDGRRILIPLLGASALVLLIACGNVGALLLVRGLQRQQEYAVRIALGMGRGALLRQTLMESLLLALLGGGLGVGFAFGVVRLFKMIAGHAVPRLDAVTAGWGVLGWGLAVAIPAATFAGLIPAVRVLRVDPVEVLKSAGPKGTAGTGERRLLRGVAMLQTSLTLALLVGAGLLTRTMIKISQVPPGYNMGRILTMSVTDVQGHTTWESFHRQALERVAALPGVQYAAFAWGVPLTGNNWPVPLEVEGQPPAMKESDKVVVPIRAVTPDYFKLMETPLLEGREFRQTDDDKAPQVGIVNQAFANQFFLHGNVVGRKFWPRGRDQPGVEIVGKIADGHTDDLTHQASPEIYVPLWQVQAFSKHLIVRTTADPRALIAAVQRELHAVDPTAAVENVKTLEQIRDESLASRTFAMRLLVGFSIVGSLLTLVGIYGVLSLSVASRRRELAIRSAVGAPASHIRRLIFGEGSRVIAGGVLIGGVLTLFVSQVLRTFLYEVQSTDLETLLVVGFLFVAIALLACWLPARRAGRIDPLEALRGE